MPPPGGQNLKQCLVPVRLGLNRTNLNERMSLNDLDTQGRFQFKKENQKAILQLLGDPYDTEFLANKIFFH